MPGNDLTALRDLVPAAATTQATARANITTILDGILNDIEPSVTPAGIDITSALSFLSGGVYSPATNLGYAHLQDRASAAAVANESIYVLGDDLYYKNGAGNSVQLSIGDAAAAGASGDIGSSGSPAYGASSVSINWDAATSEYRFKTGPAPEDLADLVMDRARFSDGGTTYYATLGAQAAMAATLAFSLPIAFPASTSIMTLTSAGLMGSTRDPSIDTITTVGNVIVGGVVVHSTYKEACYSAADCAIPSGAATNIAADGSYTSQSDTSDTIIPLRLEAGTKVSLANATVYQTSAGTLSAQLVSVDLTSGATVNEASLSSTTLTSTIVELTVSPAYVVQANKAHYLLIASTASAYRVYGAKIRHIQE